MQHRTPLPPDQFKEFVSLSTLVYLIDPVRGEPTVHSLDRHPDDPSQHHDHLYTRFLDSFALICSTSRKGSETAAAVCLERGSKSGAAVLRLARNRGVSPELVRCLESVLESLGRLSKEGTNPSSPEIEKGILLEIIAIVNDKITSLIERLQRQATQQSLEQVITALGDDSSHHIGQEGSEFDRWIKNLPRFASLTPNMTPRALHPHITWASRARWDYSDQLNSLLLTCVGGIPPWVSTMYKLGRYHAAARAMVKLAVKDPSLFRNIKIKSVTTFPAPRRFPARGEHISLYGLLQKVCRIDDPSHLIAELNRSCFTKESGGHYQKDTEAYFHRECTHTLTLHAEMQLIVFYDQNRKLSPPLRFMGTSKKACYLCHEFLKRHPLDMVVSACHQKVYPSWLPPQPLASGPDTIAMTALYKGILWDVRREMERAVVGGRTQDQQLGHRRPANLDSTAGPPVTFSSTFWTMQLSESRGWSASAKNLNHDRL